MKYKITLIPGDGTGPEIALAMRRCVDATGVDIEWNTHHAEGNPDVELYNDFIRRLDKAMIKFKEEK